MNYSGVYGPEETLQYDLMCSQKWVCSSWCERTLVRGIQMKCDGSINLLSFLLCAFLASQKAWLDFVLWCPRNWKHNYYERSTFLLELRALWWNYSSRFPLSPPSCHHHRKWSVGLWCFNLCEVCAKIIDSLYGLEYKLWLCVWGHNPKLS